MSSPTSANEQIHASSSGVAMTVSESQSGASGGDATAKVFGVDELVLLILENVPIQHRAHLRGVSKKWNSIISKFGFAVKPDLVGAFGECLEVEKEGPCYALEVAIGVNPAINGSAEASGWSYNIVTLESVSDPTKLMSKRDEFITSPPVTMITLGLRDRKCPVMLVDHHVSHAVLKEDTGIRIGHLLDMFNKMRRQALGVWEFDAISIWDRPTWPVAVFNYSGSAIVTHLEEIYVDYTVYIDDDKEDDSEGDSEDVVTDEDDNKMRLYRGSGRSVLRCMTRSEWLAQVFGQASGLIG